MPAAAFVESGRRGEWFVATDEGGWLEKEVGIVTSYADVNASVKPTAVAVALRVRA